jgi:hypothetical protein
MEVQRIKADERISADRGLVALRYGPLIYNAERADQSDVNQVLGTAPLTTGWRGDLLDGVQVIKGFWADGSPLVAVPNFARCNRFDGAGNTTPPMHRLHHRRTDAAASARLVLRSGSRTAQPQRSEARDHPKIWERQRW